MLTIPLFLVFNLYASEVNTSEPKEICFNIGIFATNSAEDMGWVLGTCVSRDEYWDNQVYYEECCLESGNYVLTCSDSGGDGWGGAYLLINYRSYCRDFDGYEYSQNFTVAEQSVDYKYCLNISLRTGMKAREMMWLVVDRYSVAGVCSSAQTYEDNSNYTVECCLENKNPLIYCTDAGADGWDNSTLAINGVPLCRDFRGASMLDSFVQTYEPTGNPTLAPTYVIPTLYPSKAPTWNPTLAPTWVPTFYPSKAPTWNPTLAPTNVPTFNPSKAPTSKPTPIPTPPPTHVSTLNPSDARAPSPTLVPILVSTYSPTFHPSEAPTCVEITQNWTEEIAEKHCSANEMGETNKGVDAIVCQGHSQFYQRRLNYSLANRAYTHCSAWCVYDIHTEGYVDPSEYDNAFIWRNQDDCWQPVRKGLCIDGNRSERDSVADYIENTLCASCFPLYTWDEDRAEEICSDNVIANKGYGVKVCDDSQSSTKQDSLEKSLANRFFTHCSAWCIYDYDTIVNNTENSSYGGFIWKNTNTCWKWITQWDCFTKHRSEFSAVSSRAANLCKL